MIPFVGNPLTVLPGTGFVASHLFSNGHANASAVLIAQ
jgi:hypothetical protein